MALPFPKEKMFQREPKAIGIAQDPWLTEIWILKRAHTCRQPVSVFTFLHSKAPNQRKKSWSCFHCNYNFIIQLTLHEKAEHQKKIFLLLTRTREKTDFTSTKRSYDFMFYLPLNYKHIYKQWFLEHYYRRWEKKTLWKCTR